MWKKKIREQRGGFWAYREGERGLGVLTCGMFWNDLVLPVSVFKGRDDGR